MVETGSLAGQSAYIQAYSMAAHDLRKALESIEKERYERDSRYMEQTKDTLLLGPALSSMDFGFFGDQHPLSSRQMTSAKRFFAHLGTLRATMLRGIGDTDLKVKQPVCGWTWCRYSTKQIPLCRVWLFSCMGTVGRSAAIYRRLCGAMSTARSWILNRCGRY